MTYSRIMGRPKLPESKVHIGCRVAPVIKAALDKIADEGQWKPAQTLEILLKSHPRVKAEMKGK